MWKPMDSGRVGVIFVAGCLLSCVPEGNSFVQWPPPEPDPCQSADLSEGIQTGADLRAVFDCANRTHELDAFVPLMDALESSVMSDGETFVLDHWVTLMNERLEQASGVELSSRQVTAFLEDAQALLEEDWIYTAVGVSGEVMESGAVEPLIPLVGSLSESLQGLMATYAWDTFRVTLIELLCPDLTTGAECSGPVQQLYAGVMDVVAERSARPGNQEALVETLAELFAPAGTNEVQNLDLNLALGRGIARVGSTDFLLQTLASDFPVLYGDDQETAAFEGYESYNADHSAVYGMLELIADDAFRARLTTSLEGVGPLLTQYYLFDPKSLDGTSEAAKSGSCSPGSGGGETSYEWDNPAYYGLDQLMRVIKSLDVDYTASTACRTLVDRGLATVGQQLELSGTTNLAALVLEIFSQLPLDLVQSATDAGSLSEDALILLNEQCGTALVPDDYEALQAVVHMDSVIGPMLELLAAVTRAQSFGGEPPMLALVRIMVGLYDTHLLCEVQPYLKTIYQGDVSLEGLVPFLPPIAGEAASEEHDTVTVPLLQSMLLMSEDASVLMPPVQDMLDGNGVAFGQLFTSLGQLGFEALMASEEGKPPALYDLDAVVSALVAMDPESEGVRDLAESLKDPVFLEAMVETLAIEEVRQGLLTPYPSSSDLNAVEFVSQILASGQVEAWLERMHELLVQLNEGEAL